MFSSRIAVILAGFATATVSCAMADSVVLTPIRDNTLFESALGNVSNGAGPALFVGRTAQGSRRRAVLMFDVAANLSHDAVIDSVTLTLHLSQVSDTSPRTLTLHRLSASWGEGASSTTSGGGTLAEPGDATWLHRFYPDSMWSTAGGDFEMLGSASAAVGVEAFHTWSGSGLVTDAQSWLTEPDSNHGWVLIGDESSNGTTRRFDSRESSPEINRPSLTVWFSSDTSPVTPTSWGHIKNLYR